MECSSTPFGALSTLAIACLIGCTDTPQNSVQSHPLNTPEYTNLDVVIHPYHTYTGVMLHPCRPFKGVVLRSIKVYHYAM